MRNLLAIAAIALMPGVALATEWHENDYNPIPMDDDIILPMPCDGRMVFRNVETNLISDVKDGAFADRSNSTWLGWRTRFRLPGRGVEKLCRGWIN